MEQIINQKENLKKELDDLKKQIDDKNNENKQLMDKYHEEAMNAKFQLADEHIKAEEELMKLKRQIKKLTTKLEGMGINVNDLK